MRKLIGTFVIIASFSTIGWSQFSFGAGAQLILDGGVFGLQGKALYDVDETWRGSGTFTIHLKEFYDWTIDLDVQYKLLEVSDNFNLAPVAGLSISKFGFAGIGGSTDIGINLGAFFDFVPSDSYHIYVEPKIVLGGVGAIAISGGLLF